MKKFIVSTTINPPTDAIRAFDAMPDWTLIVVTDLKTPKDYKLANGIVMSPRDQEKMDQALSDAIGWNCIQRRNFGFLLAHQLGADIVATVDDDNIPMAGWGQRLLVGERTVIPRWHADLPAFDPLWPTNHANLWHRGFPLQLVAQRHRITQHGSMDILPDIQADFWNEDPDVDAVCRMEHAPVCNFDPGCFPFFANRIGPFNSQNTFLAAHVLKDYFMFPGVGRMDDIWPSFYVQALGYRVVWNKASVIQKRNPHDPMEDMLGSYSELLGYKHNLEIVTRLATDPEAIWEYVPGRCRRAFELYRRHFE